MNEQDDSAEVVWDDEKIDEKAKEYLKERRMGRVLQSDTIAHLEFFYNTRRFHHKTANPFENPEQYPALLYKDERTSETLLQVHRKIIMPEVDYCDERNPDSDAQSVSSIDKKYDWYPNRQIESPFSLVTASPSPKKLTGERRQTQFNLVMKPFEMSNNSASPIKVQSIRRNTQFTLKPISERIGEHEDMDQS